MDLVLALLMCYQTKILTGVNFDSQPSPVYLKGFYEQLGSFVNPTTKESGPCEDRVETSQVIVPVTVELCGIKETHEVEFKYARIFSQSPEINGDQYLNRELESQREKAVKHQCP